jgi:hypothetical protein
MTHYRTAFLDNHTQHEKSVFIYLSVCLVSILFYSNTECHSNDCRSADSRGALSMSSSNDHLSPNFRDDKQARILTSCGSGVPYCSND